MEKKRVSAFCFVVLILIVYGCATQQAPAEKMPEPAAEDAPQAAQEPEPVQETQPAEEIKEEPIIEEKPASEPVKKKKNSRYSTPFKHMKALTTVPCMAPQSR